MYTTVRLPVSTTPTQLDLPKGSVNKPVDFGVQNPTGQPASCWLGGPNVATSGATVGWEIAAGQSFSDDIISDDGAPWVVSTTNINITVLYEI